MSSLGGQTFREIHDQTTGPHQEARSRYHSQGAKRENAYSLLSTLCGRSLINEWSIRLQNNTQTSVHLRTQKKMELTGWWIVLESHAAPKERIDTENAQAYRAYGTRQDVLYVNMFEQRM